MANIRAVVYGLSTEGYTIASAMAVKGVNVSIVDEAKRMATALRPEVARMYTDVSALKEDEPLLGLEPEEVAVEKADYLIFAPKIRKTGQEVKGEISTKFKDATKSLKKNASIIYNLPTGIGGNNDNIALIEHVTGLSVGSDLNYYYMPLGPGEFSPPVGSFKSKADANMSKFFQDFVQGGPKFVDLSSAEFMHAIRVLSHYSAMASTFEMCKYVTDTGEKQGLEEEEFTEIYFDDIASGLFDLRAIASSLEGAGPLMYLVNGSIKSTEGYLKHLIDRIRDVLKKRELKASKTRVAVAWTLDGNEMRGDRLDLFATLESKLRDYIGDVERHGGEDFDLYQSDKVTITIACSKHDYEAVTKRKSDMILLKANPLCEVV